ncbi:hypothetical protein M413DRAFT_116987 [Hebeloma cylindrosporum]|uniref:Uncharacterized protein n=1 Tax=Hebeloma cylindrosporum TaxID=76867 RepID=A0A0C3CMC9_HEBCY|nr:hypothetical protein M413DRAFT_116987 [Hebeloma cylindrosporum h7]
MHIRRWTGVVRPKKRTLSNRRRGQRELVRAAAVFNRRWDSGRGGLTTLKKAGCEKEGWREANVGHWDVVVEDAGVAFD